MVARVCPRVGATVVRGSSGHPEQEHSVESAFSSRKPQQRIGGRARGAAGHWTGHGEKDRRGTPVRGDRRSIEGGSSQEHDRKDHADGDGRRTGASRGGARTSAQGDCAAHVRGSYAGSTCYGATTAGQGNGLGQPGHKGVSSRRRPVLRKHEEREVHDRSRRRQGRISRSKNRRQENKALTAG